MRSTVAIEHTGTSSSPNLQVPQGCLKCISSSVENRSVRQGRTLRENAIRNSNDAVIRIGIVLGHRPENVCTAKHKRANMGKPSQATDHFPVVLDLIWNGLMQ
jgi:hypothetical protein